MNSTDTKNDPALTRSVINVFCGFISKSPMLFIISVSNNARVGGVGGGGGGGNMGMPVVSTP